MPDFTTSSSTNRSYADVGPRSLIAVALLALVLFVPRLGARDLWNPNEPTYGRAVVEMAERGSWFVPTVNDAVFAEKPILYFWLARIFALLIGAVDELTLRLPSALSGVLAVVLVFCLVRPYCGVRRGALAGGLLATTFVVFWSARAVQMDLLVGATTLLAVLAATRVVDHGADARWGWGLSGVAAGLGFLAKGPVGLIVPGLVISGYLASTGRLREAFRPALVAAAAGFVVVGLPWYLLLWLRGETAFLFEVLYRQNVLRFVEPWDHQAPWHYYLKYFWIDMAPWSLFVPLAWGLQPVDENEARLHRLAWIWILVLLLFFSLSASKRSPYILPLAPAVAVLVAALAERWWSGGLARSRRRAALALCGLLGVALLVVAVRLVVDPRTLDSGASGLRLAAWIVAGVAALTALGILIGMLFLWRRRLASALALFGGVVTLYMVVSTVALPAVNDLKSHRAMSETIRSHVRAGAALRGFHEWRWRGGYSFYMGRAIPNLATIEELRDYWSGPAPVYLIVERGRLPLAREVLGPIEPLADRAIGNNHAYLFGSGRVDVRPDP